MSSKDIRRPARLGVLGAATLCAALTVGGGAALAQSAPASSSAPSNTAPNNSNCAVTTARIGSLDVTEFFGLAPSATTFNQGFGVSAMSQPATGISQTTSPSTMSEAQRCIRLELENPAPGDVLPVGGYVLEGFAFDPTVPSSQGAGISGIQVFLGDPNQGGQILGTASMNSASAGQGEFGLTSTRAGAFGEQFSNAGFRMTIQVPATSTGSEQALFVSATSSNGSRIGTVAVPVAVGEMTPVAREAE